MAFVKELVKGLWNENPTFRIVLGMCPTLAVTTSVQNALGMGVATLFVLVGSNLVISAVRKVIPGQVRIPCYIVIVATFVTIVELLMRAYTLQLSKSLGIFIPLIVVNCIILGRAEAFACRNTVLDSIADGIGMGLGFTLALSAIAVVREIIGSGSVTIWNSLAFQVSGYEPVLLAILPPGGFITLACLLALMNRIEARRAARAGRAFAPPEISDCRHCIICSWSSAPAPADPEKKSS